MPSRCSAFNEKFRNVQLVLPSVCPNSLGRYEYSTRRKNSCLLEVLGWFDHAPENDEEICHDQGFNDALRVCVARDCSVREKFGKFDCNITIVRF